MVDSFLPTTVNFFSVEETFSQKTGPHQLPPLSLPVETQPCSRAEFTREIEVRVNGPISGGNNFVGVAFLVLNSTMAIEGSANFTNNRGGGITLLRCNFTCRGDAFFANNRRNQLGFGAAVFADNSTLSFIGRANFLNNTVLGGVGGAIFRPDV